MAAPYLRGVDPQTEGSVSILPRSIVAGTFDLSGRGMVIGSGFAEAQRLQVGDTLSILPMRQIKKMVNTAGKANAESAFPTTTKCAAFSTRL